MRTPLQVFIEQVLSNHLSRSARCGSFHLKLVRPGYEPLVIERIFAPDHGCMVFSVKQTYTQNGDLMNDPEMCFDAQTWEPLYYRQDGLHIEQYVYPDHPDRRRVFLKRRGQLKTFAREWTQALRHQGFAYPGANIVAFSNTHPLRGRGPDGAYSYEAWVEQVPTANVGSDPLIIWPDGSTWP